MPRTLTPETLKSAQKPTFYFIGVTTGSSSIRTVFPRWAERLGLGDVELVGIDLPLHADRDAYRRVVSFIKEDTLSRGALVTTHKMDIYDAARDLFDELDDLAVMMDEISSISKRGDRLIAHAKDPISSGFALDTFIPAGYFESEPTDVVIFGAGGSAIAIDWYLSHPRRGTDRPSRIVVTNRSAPRLSTLRRVHELNENTIPLTTEVAEASNVNDDVLAAAAPRSIVINATGLGKDAPGSPLTDAAIFPERAIAWDLNYRGDLIYLSQARAQAGERSLQIEDGWIYFIHGWTQVIAEVFDIEIPARGRVIDDLSAIAAGVR